MKRVSVSIAALVASACAAFAADLPSRKGPPVLPPPPPPPPMWTGFYVGLNAGGTWANSTGANIVAFPGPSDTANNFDNEALASAAVASGYHPTGSNGGFIGGGQIGYNFQFYNNFVVGIEADIQGIAASSAAATSVRATSVPNFPSETMVSAGSVSKSLDYIGTVRGRLGWLFTPTLLIYGTGGFAYGGVSSSTSIFQSNVDTAGVANAAYGSFGAFSDTRVGWTAGGGVEWMFMPNWSAKAEYLYYDLGSVTYASSPLVAVVPLFNAPTWSSLPSTNARFDGHIVRAGVNYHFNWGAPAPVVAKY